MYNVPFLFSVAFGLDFFFFFFSSSDTTIGGGGGTFGEVTAFFMGIDTLSIHQCVSLII
jgi:hypothetical protein